MVTLYIITPSDSSTAGLTICTYDKSWYTPCLIYCMHYESVENYAPNMGGQVCGGGGLQTSGE